MPFKTFGLYTSISILKSSDLNKWLILKEKKVLCLKSKFYKLLKVSFLYNIIYKIN